VKAELLIDNSVWARLWDGRLKPEVRERTAEDVASGRIGICLPLALEAGYSARDIRGYDELSSRLLELPYFSFDAQVERRSIEAQGQLVRSGHHRLPPIDLLVAAVAERYELGVLHYDSDYDVIAERTDLGFESRWLAPRGSL
jgi:predicted nucleic acid-binding protein